MNFTDIFIRRPVLAIVVSLLILMLGLRALGSLGVRQYPQTQNAVVTVTTVYTGADSKLVAGFITTPLENSIAQANGIDYLTSSSSSSVSVIKANLRLNYDVNKALTEINTKINAVLNQLPKESQQPTITIDIGETVDSMYMGFTSKILPANKITDYIIRVVQPKLQAVDGVQTAEILGGRPFALRAWLDPVRMAAHQITASDVSAALAANDIVSAVGRTKGQMVTVDLTAATGLHSIEEFKNLIIKSVKGALIHLSDVANVSLGSEDYDTNVRFDTEGAVFVGIKVAPTANLLTVLNGVSKVFPTIQKELPDGLNGVVMYDSSQYINSAIHEVIKTLGETLLIVTVVIFLFLGSLRSVLVPVLAMPLSIIGTFFVMLLLGYTLNLLTLLSLVLAIGLVVDDAIIVVENIHRHIEAGMSPLDAAVQGARELTGPIIAMTVVLIAVYIPIGFMGGLTGALFTEFAFSLAGAVVVSAIVALTLSPMMCAKLFKSHQATSHQSFSDRLDRVFDRLRETYQKALHGALNSLPVIGVFAGIILLSIIFLFLLSRTELAPDEDHGFIISSYMSAPNASLEQTSLYSRHMFKILKAIPEVDHVFQADGLGAINSGFTGMVLKPWETRARLSKDIKNEVEAKISRVSGLNAVAFLPPPLPGAGQGLPFQFVVGTTEGFNKLYDVSELLMQKAKATGMFVYINSDLKIDKPQTQVQINREKAAQMGLSMRDVGASLGSMLGGGYVNYFSLFGRSYKVIPQVLQRERLNAHQINDYYITTATGVLIPLSTLVTLKTTVVPESINHFQQLNSATVMAVTSHGVTMGQALATMKSLAKDILPQGYSIDYAGQLRQFVQESNALTLTFIFALIIIFLALAALFESFRDPLIVLVSVPMSIFGAMIFINWGINGASLNIYTEVGLVTLIGLISKHGILIVQFANDLQREGKSKREAIETAAGIRLRPILMTTAAMVFGVLPLVMATGAGAAGRFNMGLVIMTGISIGTFFTLFVVPTMYMFLASTRNQKEQEL